MKTSSAGRRRSRYGLLTLILFSILTLGIAFAIALGEHFSTRYDLTSTREHTLSQRTLDLLDVIDQPHTIVIAARMQQIDARGVERLRDLLDAFGAASSQVGIREINLNSPDAPERADEVVRLSMEHHGEAIGEHERTIDRAAESLESIAEQTAEAAALARRLIERLPPGELRRAWDENTTALTALPPLAREASDTLQTHRAMTAIGEILLPQADAALTAIEPTFSTVELTLAGMMALAQQSSQSQSREDAALARDVLERAERARTTVLQSRDALSRLGPLDPLSVARVLLAQQALLVIGPTQTTAIDFSSILPEQLGEASLAPLRSKAESLLTSALAASSDPVLPVLVLVHAETIDLFQPNGRLIPGAEQQMGALVQRLRQERVTLREWSVARSPLPPSRAQLGIETPDTPVVWFVIGAPASGPLGDRIDRRNRLAIAIQRLVQAGESILLTVSPSELPAIGETDPLVESLPLFGFESDSGRLLVRRVAQEGGPQAAVDFTLRRGAGDHPIAQSLEALPTFVDAATPLRLTNPPPPITETWSILEIPSDPDTWAMAAWQSLLRTGFARLPAPDAARDDVDGPWIVALGAQRPHPLPEGANTRQTKQRIVAVSATRWFTDPITQASLLVDGVPVRRFPGNNELFDASFAWLAGLDERIGAGPSVRDLPRIDDLSDAQILAIRWTLILALPVLVLLTGLFLRWLSG